MGAQPPFEPSDLKHPPMDGDVFIHFLKQEMVNRYPHPPAFYQALYNGSLSIDDLKRWVKDLYMYWDYGVVYSTAAIFVKTNDETTRTNILRKLIDIEGENIASDLSGSTTPAWEELWLRFGESLGLSRADIVSAKPFTRTYFAITTLCTYSRYWDWSWLDGIASFYAADLHGSKYLRKAYEALKHHYGIPEDALEFFHVYLSDTESHIPWEESTLAYWCCTTERQLTAARAFRERLDIENQLLFALEKSRTGEYSFTIP